MRRPPTLLLLVGFLLGILLPMVLGVPPARADPTGFSATATSSGTLHLTWTNDPSYPDGIKLYRDTTNGFTPGPGNQIYSSGTSTATSYDDTGLTNGVTYYYAIQNKDGGTNTWSGYATTSGVPSTTPSAPTGLTTTSVQPYSTGLTWTAPSNGGSAITGYVVKVIGGTTDCSATGGNDYSTGSSSPGYTAGASAGFCQTYYVAAVNARGQGAWSARLDVSNPTTTPDAPTTPTSPSHGVTYVNLAYGEGAHNGGRPVSSFVVRRVLCGGGGQVDSNVGYNTNPTMSGLSASTCYRFSVAAVTSVGQGSFSGTVDVTTDANPPSPVPPGAPSNEGADPVGTTTATAHWSPPFDNGGASIDNYQVVYCQWSGGCVGGTTSLYTGSGSTLQLTITGLTPSTNYAYAVYAHNTAGWGAGSNSLGFTTGSATNVPSAPTSPSNQCLFCPAIGRTWAKFGWTVPNTDGGSTILNYTIRLGTSSGTYTRSVVINTGAGYNPPFNVTGLSPSTTYYWLVYASNANGAGANSTEVVFTTAANGPPGAPQSLDAVVVHSNDATLEWTAPADDGGATITGYHIEWKTGTYVQTADVPASPLTYQLTGLWGLTTYYLNVSAVNSYGTGPNATQWFITYPNGTAFTSPPSAPLSVLATSITNSSAVATWSAPSETGGVEIDNYRVTYCVHDACVPVTMETGSGSARNLAIAGLASATRYDFNVTAHNSDGWGTVSSTASFTTLTTASGRIDAVAEAQADNVWGLAVTLLGVGVVVSILLSVLSRVRGG